MLLVLSDPPLLICSLHLVSSISWGSYLFLKNKTKRSLVVFWACKICLWLNCTDPLRALSEAVQDNKKRSPIVSLAVKLVAGNSHLFSLYRRISLHNFASFVNPSLFTMIEGRILLRNQRSNILASPCSPVPAHYTAKFCLSLLQPSAHGGAKQSCRSCSSPCQSKQRSRTPNPRALHNKVASQLFAQNRRRVSLRPWTTERITIERATLEWITNTLPENWNVKMFQKKIPGKCR